MIKHFKNLNTFQILLMISIILIIFRNTCYFKSEIIGKYVSNAQQPTLEMPGKGAELFLHENGTYTSNSIMGEGKYKIEGSSIELTSNKRHSRLLPLARKFNIAQPMIVINSDLEYYFIKE